MSTNERDLLRRLASAEVSSHGRYSPGNPFAQGGDAPARQYSPGNPFAPSAESRAYTGETNPVDVEAIARQGATLAQGPTLGLADEIKGGVAAVGALVPGGRSPGEAYAETRDAERARVEQFTDEAGGITSAGTQMLGALPVILATGGGAAPPGAGATSLGALQQFLRRPIAGSAVVGAVSGVGMAEGGVGERVTGGAIGGTVGAASGGLIRGGSRASNIAADLIPGVRDKVAPVLAAAREAVFPAGQPAPAGTEARMTGGFFGRTRGYLGAEGPPRGPIQTRTQRADDIILDALDADQVDVPELARRAMESRGPVALADLGGDNLRGVTRGARSVQGSTAKDAIPTALGQRVRSQEERVLGYVLDDSGLGQRTNILGTLDEIAETRRAEAAQLYGAIRDRPVQSLAVRAAFRRPAFERAYGRAVDIRENEIAEAVLAGAEPPAALPALDDLLAGRAELTLGTLDQVKRGLDDVIYSAKREGLGNQQVGSLERVRHEFVRQLDRLVPEYRTARSAFAGRVAMGEALEEGAKLFDMEPEAARRALAAMGDSEREMFRRGGLEALARRVENTSSRLDITKRRPLDDITRDRQRLRLLFDDEAGFRDFQEAIREEARMAATNSFVTGGSNTMDKLGETALIAGVDLGDVLSLASGAPPAGLLMRAVQGGARRGREGAARRNADALSSRLTAGTDGDRRSLLRVLSELDEAARAREADRARGMATRVGAALVAGGGTGRSATSY